MISLNSSFTVFTVRDLAAAKSFYTSHLGFKVAFEKFMPTAAGRPIELIFEDTASKADLALQKAKKLVERDKVAILCGPLHGGHAMGVSAYTDKMKVPQFNPGTNTEGLLLARKWSLISGVPLAGISYPVGTYAYKEKGYRTCSVLATDRHVGHEFMKGFFLSFKALGGKVLQEHVADRPRWRRVIRPTTALGHRIGGSEVAHAGLDIRNHETTIRVTYHLAVATIVLKQAYRLIR